MHSLPSISLGKSGSVILIKGGGRVSCMTAEELILMKLISKYDNLYFVVHILWFYLFAFLSSLLGKPIEKLANTFVIIHN